MDEPKLSLVEKRQRALDKRSKLIKELEIDVCRLKMEDYSNIEDPPKPVVLEEKSIDSRYDVCL